MNTDNQNHTHYTCGTYKTCSLGVLLIILIIIGAIAFLMFFCGHKTALHLFNFNEFSGIQQEIGHNGILMPDMLLSTITDFYTNIIVILTAFIGILSIVGFLYIKNISNKEVVQAVNDVVAGEHFKAYLKSIIKEAVEKHIEDDSDLSDIVEKYAALANLKERIEFLEKAVQNGARIIETEGDKNGSNTTIE
ncbi:hypothetical protein [Candidatus Avelusimicrobium sp.]|uniref:hypothetical protein n=1 Tax=Candidatus Avelusimicrobium sp. TaxID=3048833 RepID=UPI003F816120